MERGGSPVEKKIIHADLNALVFRSLPFFSPMLLMPRALNW
jgi:hypothetical protein